jgi:hypothetical protein
MNEPTPAQQALALPCPSPPPDGAQQGVRGWLLLLCLMLTLIGPAISLGLMANLYQLATQAAPFRAGSPGVQAAVFGALALMGVAVVYGAHAGVRLWLIRPNAVRTAKRALLLGLVADIVATTVEVAMAAQPGERLLLLQVELHLLPSLLFFALGLAYLNKSGRVEATYGGQ